MTITDVSEMWSSRTSSKQSDDGKTFKVTYAAAYNVVHTADTTENQILLATGIPRLRDGYGGNPYIPCTSVSASKVGPILSIVSVNWAGEISEDGGTPVDQKAKWKLTSMVSQEETDTDGLGYPITNTIGEPVDGLKKDIWDWKLDISQNYSAYNSYALEQYANAVNSDYFGPPGNIWPPGTAKIQSISVEPSDDDDIGYFKTQISILFRSPVNTTPLRSWWWRYRNEGNYERTGTTVTFSSPTTGNTAAGYAIASSGGAITAIAVTNPGSGYTSAPTVTITSSTGGTGATATATINSNGRVTGVSIGAGGSGYKSKLVRAVDSNKEPVSKPVLLAADGTRLDNSDSAFFNERPRYSYYLPFSSLGFNF